MPPLQCTVLHIVRYVAYLGKVGTISGDSLQPYLSAINRLYVDNRLEPVALGPLVTDAVGGGLRGMQVPVNPKPKRVALPADAAKALHDDAFSLSEQKGELRPFRDALSTVVSFMWFNRSDTNHGVFEDDLQVDPENLPAQQIRLFPRRRKGKRRQQLLHKVRTANVPVAAHPQLAVMLTRYKERRLAAFAEAGLLVPAQLWALPGDVPSKWTSNVQNQWMSRALRRLNLAAPPGFTWTSHSLRSGPASAAHALGVPEMIIKFYGHWAKNSSVWSDYIDQTVRPSRAGRFFFGWLLKENAETALSDSDAES